MRALLAAVAAAVVLFVGAAIPAGGQAAAEPTDEVLAVLSPIAAPACLSVGLSTVLVPLIGDQLGSAFGGSVDVTTLLQQATGPVLVVCGSFPPPDGIRCALVDGPIELIWPEQLRDLSPSPAPLGGVVEALTKLVTALGLPDLGLEPVIGCSIPVAPGGGAGDPVPPPDLPGGTPAAPIPSAGGSISDGMPPLALHPSVTPGSSPGALADAVVPVVATPGSPGVRGPIMGAAAVIAFGVLWFGARPRTAQSSTAS